MRDERSDTEEHLLVMDAQDGDAKAMQELVRRWQKRLWKHVVRLTADADGAWDVTQETWLAIITGLRRLHDPAAFGVWAYRIATNKSVDWIRARKAAPEQSIDVADVGAQTHKKEIGIIELLQKLDVRRRAVLTLHYFEDLSVAEIGAVLGIAEGTVKSRLHVGRKELRELWQRHSR